MKDLPLKKTFIKGLHPLQSSSYESNSYRFTHASMKAVQHKEKCLLKETDVRFEESCHSYHLSLPYLGIPREELKSSQTPSGSHHRQSWCWTCISRPHLTRISAPVGTYPPAKKNEERPRRGSSVTSEDARKAARFVCGSILPLPPRRISLLDRPCQRHQRSF